MHEPITIGSAIRAVSSSNALNFNRLAYGQIALGHLALERIALERVSSSRLRLSPTSGLDASAEGRELLYYVAQCALEPGDILFAERDGVLYEFPGLLGVASEWEHGPLDAAQRELLSACLLAHVNAFGLSVSISVRSPGVLLAGEAERSSHPVYEGTFFGEVIGGQLNAYACTGSTRKIATAQSYARQLRVCADTDSACAIDVVGRCRDVCDTYTAEYGWQGCWANGRRHAFTVSTFLRASPGTISQRCDAGEICSLWVSERPAMLECGAGGSCDIGCLDGSYCTIQSDDSAEVYMLAWGSMAEVGCQHAGACAAWCTGGSSCEVDCHDAGSCEQIYCDAGAQCLLDCTGADTCGFETCSGGETTCAGGVVVCNRPCP